MDRRLLAVPVVGLILMTACGGDSSSSSKPALPRLTIDVSDPTPGRFEYLAPKRVQAGVVEIRLTNTGDEVHKAQLWRLGGGHSVDEALKAGRPLPGWLRTAGGVALTEPKQTGITVQRLAPGNYYVAGAGNERGRVATFRVTGSDRPANLPPAKATLTADEYEFRFPSLEAGRQRFLFRNVGNEPHHAYFARMAGGATLDDVRGYLRRGVQGDDAPVRFDQGVVETPVIEGGDRQVTELNLASGRYALLCFVSDRAGGPSHIEKGMVSEVRVK